MRRKAFVQMATKVKWTGVRSIDVSRFAEHDEIHVDSLLSSVKEFEHELEIRLTRLVDSDQLTVSGHTLELSEMAEEVMNTRNNQGKMT